MQKIQINFLDSIEKYGILYYLNKRYLFFGIEANNNLKFEKLKMCELRSKL